MSTLVEGGYEVHSLDLLGQGKSDKPGRKDGVEYSIDLWAELVDDYVQEKIKGDIVLMGNSLGSVVALSAATGDFVAMNEKPGFISGNGAKGICLFNCGIGMNSQGVADEPQWNPVQRLLIKTVFNILNALIFGNQALLGYVLDNVVTTDFLRNALQNLYLISPDRVDDELVESFYLPAKEDGAVDALSQIYTNDPGKTPMQMYQDNMDKISKVPIHVVWGEEDPVTPLGGPVGQFFLSQAESSDHVSFDLVQSGHIPFDDNPVQSNGAMMQWLTDVVENGAGTKKQEVGFEGFGRVLLGR